MASDERILYAGVPLYICKLYPICLYKWNLMLKYERSQRKSYCISWFFFVIFETKLSNLHYRWWNTCSSSYVTVRLLYFICFIRLQPRRMRDSEEYFIGQDVCVRRGSLPAGRSYILLDIYRRYLSGYTSLIHVHELQLSQKIKQNNFPKSKMNFSWQIILLLLQSPVLA